MMFIHDGESIPVAPSIGVTGSSTYGCDWTNDLDDGESIATSIWSIEPVITLSDESNANGITGIRVSNAVLDHVYKLTNTITTSDGDKEPRSMYITCKQL